MYSVAEYLGTALNFRVALKVGVVVAVVCGDMHLKSAAWDLETVTLKLHSYSLWRYCSTSWRIQACVDRLRDIYEASFVVC